MRYVEARLEEYDREEAYRIYVTRSLQLAPQMKSLKVSYMDIISNNVKEEKEETGDDIAVKIITDAGLNFG